MFSHLHVRSWFSFLAGGSAPEDYVEQIREMGMKALALTDVNGVYGVVRFQQVCKEAGIKPIFGAEARVEAAPADAPSGMTDGFVRPEDGSPRIGGGFPRSRKGALRTPSAGTLVLLAASQKGYSNLCRILTAAHLRDRDEPHVFPDELAEHRQDLFCLTGTYDSRLWALLDAGRMGYARRWVGRLEDIFDDRLSIEAAHHLLPGDRRRLQRLRALSEETGVPLVATGDVRYAVPEHYRRYDLMTCIRNGITVFEGHADRPRNAEAYVKDEAAMRKLIPWPEAFERAEQIAEACRVDLLPGYITPPAARVETGESCKEYLVRLCREGFERRYGVPPEKEKAPEPEEICNLRPATCNRMGRPAAQLEKELNVILDLNLEEFFLVVHEIVEEARRRGIRCAGRGSAANSIVAYLLGITEVDPLEHRLLFERFLHGGRKGTPDIDVDFDSERREEVISWMEERFGMEQTAMTATLVTYRLRSAVRDVAKALGWPMETVDKLSKAVPPSRAHAARDHRVSLEQVVRSSPLLDTLLEMVESLADCPRHLGLHSGGMVLSRKPLHHFTPVQISANGVKMVQFDKYDVEALGLVKLDVLGLRMLASVSEAVELIQRHEDPDFRLEAIPFDDIPTFNMIRASETLGTFQIESQGQLHLLAQHQPETFDDLITEIALFRPGPLQGGMVHPFVRRRRGDEPVTYDHPDLEPVLKDTYGIILFQEQVLEVAHKFAGMSLSEADDFRALMSRFRDPGEMEQMRDRFVSGAMKRGVDEPTANDVFDKVSNFVGYGFCRSHAAAFAKTVYESCYLKKHHPAAFMAAVMQHRPGMYNLMTLQEEARRFGAETLPPDVNRSGVRYEVELEEDAGDADSSSGASRNAPSGSGGRVGTAGRANDFDGRANDYIGRANGFDGHLNDWGHRRPSSLAIRKPLTAVKELSVDDARHVVWERLESGPFTSVEDFYRRMPLGEDVLRSLARSGAFDALAENSRRALWEVGLLLRSPVPRGRRPSKELFSIRAFTEDDVPDLPDMRTDERLRWDYETHGSARRHPMTLMRRTLSELEIRPIETCYRLGRYFSVGERGKGQRHPIVTVAGLSVLRQRPPTAQGVMFVTLEDETGFVQCVVHPNVLELLDHVLRQSALIIRGELHIQGNWRGLIVTNAWALNGIFGGYEGHPCHEGGRDTLVVRAEEIAEN